MRKGAASCVKVRRRGYDLPMCKYIKMEPADGFEPPTDGLQNRCSTTELSWLERFFNMTLFLEKANFFLKKSSFFLPESPDFRITKRIPSRKKKSRRPESEKPAVCNASRDYSTFLP